MQRGISARPPPPMLYTAVLGCLAPARCKCDRFTVSPAGYCGLHSCLTHHLALRPFNLDRWRDDLRTCLLPDPRATHPHVKEYYSIGEARGGPEDAQTVETEKTLHGLEDAQDAPNG